MRQDAAAGHVDEQMHEKEESHPHPIINQKISRVKFVLRQYAASTSSFTSAFSCESPKLGSGLPLTKNLGVL